MQKKSLKEKKEKRKRRKKKRNFKKSPDLHGFTNEFYQTNTGKKDIIHQNLFQKTEAMETLPLTAKTEKKKYKKGKLQINRHMNCKNPQ